jgi:DegV family protein with EDD domain
MRIVTDCAADLPLAELLALNIAQAHLHIGLPDRQVTSAEVDIDEFYDLLESSFPTIPTTSQPSVGEFVQLYEQHADGDDEVISVHISSGLSGTAASAALAGQQLEGRIRVHVVDTMTLSGGERFQVLLAARAAEAGWAVQRVVERLEQIRNETETVFTLETLEYLARGGRIGRVAGLLGSLLKLKPVIRVEHADGKYSNVSKARTIPQALDTITQHLTRLYGDKPLWVSVMHGRFAGPAEQLAAKLSASLHIGRLDILRVSPVLGVHTGPGVVGAAAVPLSLVEDLLPA